MLLERAELARARAYAPYSRFHVGAALLASDGRIFDGCNIENSSFGLSVCAERNAMWKAVAEGVRAFEAMAVTAGTKHGASPCGACRQVMHEFAPNLWIIWRGPGGRVMKRRLSRLLDAAFDFPRGVA
jgi:cytidine deaminase